MNINKLKIKISGSLLLLLLAGMMLVNIVVGVIWYKSLIKVANENYYKVIQGTLFSIENLDLSLDETATKRMIKEVVGERCEGVDIRAVDKTTRKYIVEKTKGKSSGKQGIVYRLSLPHPTLDKKEIVVLLDYGDLHLEVIQSQPVILFYILINLLILTTLGFFRMAKTIIRPIDKLIEISEKYQLSDEYPFTSYPGGSEFNQLSYALNSMLEKIKKDKLQLEKNVSSLETMNQQLRETRDIVIRAEKLAAVGRLAAGLAHEIGNPVGIVSGYLELLTQSDLDENDRKQYVERAQGELDRINKMVRQLLDYSRKPKPQVNRCSAKTVISDVNEMVIAQPQTVEIEYECSVYDGLDEIEIAYDDLYQIILNCLFNSIDAIKDKGGVKSGKIKIFSKPFKHQYGELMIGIVIQDDGVGIPEDQLDKVFDPFFTTKEVGRGTGLGLSVIYGMVEAASGEIDLKSEVGVGTEITFCFPAVKK